MRRRADMNQALAVLADEIRLAEPACARLRLAFGLACASRVEAMLEDERAVAGLRVLRDHVNGATDAMRLQAAADELQRVANSHRGSNSIDGSRHAAVSATYAVAHALAGRALDAAGYAAYAVVYSYGGYAVADPAAFEAEHAWQVGKLRELAGDRPAARHDAHLTLPCDRSRTGGGP